MEIVRNSEQQKQARIMELKTSIKDIRNLLDQNLVSGGARDRLKPSLEQYEQELSKLTGKSEDQQSIAA